MSLIQSVLQFLGGEVSPMPSSGPVGQNVLTMAQAVAQMQRQGWKDANSTSNPVPQQIPPQNTQVPPQQSPQQQAIQSVVSSNQQSQGNNAISRIPDFNQKPLTPPVASAISGAANEFNLKPSLLYDISWHEGGLRPDAANTSPAGQAAGVPRGLYQFTPGTWNHDLVNYAKTTGGSFKNWLVNGNAPDINDPVANARAAAYLISHGQLERWDASKPGWGKYYAPQELSSYYSQSPGYNQSPSQ